MPHCAPADVIAIPRRLKRAVYVLARSRTEPAHLVERASIVVLAAEGLNNADIGRRLGCSSQTVRKWRHRFSTTPALKALHDRPRSGRPAVVAPSDRAALIKLACNRPKDSAFRNVWSLRGLRAALLDDVARTLSVSEIGRVLRAAEIRRHRMKVWLHSPDPEFRPKVKRIADL